MITYPRPIQFTPEELDLIAAALRDVQLSQAREEVRDGITDGEKARAKRMWFRAAAVLRKVREA